MRTDAKEFEVEGCLWIVFVALMGMASVLASIAIGLYFGAACGFAAIAACVLVLATCIHSILRNAAKKAKEADEDGDE